MSNSPIGFLDSGIGGSTVLTRAVKILPCENYFFFSDSKNCPYGDKTDDEINERCSEIIDYMVSGKHCKAVVLACNTASAKSSAYLREKYKDLPIIAIEPAYKMVHDINPDGFTLVMATKGTIESEKFHRLFYKYYNENSGVIPCAGLADLIEDGNKAEVKKYLKDALKDYAGIAENVVLGCTHYPLVKDSICAVLGDVMFFDGAEGVARQLKKVLSERGLLTSSSKKGTTEFLDSSEDEQTRALKEERFFRILNTFEG